MGDMTAGDAASELGITHATLMRMIRDGEIASRKVGAHLRLKSADVATAKRDRLVRQCTAFDELRRFEDALEQP